MLRAVWAVTASLAAPLQSGSEAYRAARGLLPERFRETETAHFVVLSEAGRGSTREHAAHLERAFEQVQRFAGTIGAQPRPLRHKLVCVLFSDRAGFAEFAARHDGVSAAWSCGYYSLRHDRTVLLDGREERGADEFAGPRAMATAIHEVAHQIHYQARLQTPHVQYPLWVAEGLATAYETGDPEAAFGPDHDYEPRRQRFLSLVSSGRLIPLRAFVQLDSVPDDRAATVFTVYNQSYGLVTWLARRRPENLGLYLELMLREPPGRPSPQRHLELFEEAFGDVASLEAAWRSEFTEWKTEVAPSRQDAGRSRGGAAAEAQSRGEDAERLTKTSQLPRRDAGRASRPAGVPILEVGASCR